ncbi:unnamed protein product [Orchesella dallaii]|uniref:Beta/gamma crystallin 'Greek key' domain-containing protein n=1 Tax=Orchesella dallaii TaxID=48710 RepID=A0ABP1R7B2_9HEXA
MSASSCAKSYKFLTRFHEASLLFLVLLLLFWCESVQGKQWKYVGSGYTRSRSGYNNIYVSLYEHENFRGKVYRQPISKECTNLPRAYNDWASSIILHDRCVTLCEYRDCQGPCIDVIPNEKGKKRLSAFGLNDKLSSVKQCNQFF